MVAGLRVKTSQVELNNLLRFCSLAKWGGSLRQTPAHGWGLWIASTVFDARNLKADSPLNCNISRALVERVVSRACVSGKCCGNW